MESCCLPIELCEAVMDALTSCYEFGLLLIPGYMPGYSETVDGQRALCACALTCRAWRVRAQYLLSAFPHIRNDARLAHFTMAVQESPITGLTLGSEEWLDPSKASDLFMRSGLRLQHLRCIDVLFDRGPPSRLLRMRLPFFASITTLLLWSCAFQSFRAMMDVVWACPNLTMLNISAARFYVEPCSAVGRRQMSAAVENLRACKKLTTLYLDLYASLTTWGATSVGLSGVGRVFGCAVTELYFNNVESYFHEMFRTLLRDSFPALHSVTVTSISSLTRFHEPSQESQELVWLHSIATDCPIPGRLKKIVLHNMHNQENNHCCKPVVGTSEKVAGPELWLPELLSGLAELTIQLDECMFPERCARYIWSVLPGMRDVLRVQYRGWQGNAWEPYTLPVAT